MRTTDEGGQVWAVLTLRANGTWTLRTGGDTVPAVTTSGRYTYRTGVLTLINEENQPMRCKVTWSGENSMVLSLPGTGDSIRFTRQRSGSSR